MMKIAALVLMIGLAAAAPMAKLSTLSEVEKKAMFLDHMVRFGKEYTAKEMPMRFEAFKSSLARIDEKNARDPKATFGVTKFSDLTTEEFRAMYLNPRIAEAKKVVAAAPKVNMLTMRPTVNVTTDDGGVDWRTKVGQYMGPVRNQGQCGSCWAFSTVENVASVAAVAGNQFVELSPQQLVDCDTASYGCNGGEPSNAYEYIINNGGIESEQSYPYTAQNGQCQASSGNNAATISSWNQVASGGSDAVQQMKTAVATVPLSVCVEADTWQDYTGGVLSSNCGQNIDHCVMLAGYGSEQGSEIWIVRNSWGSSWGEQGYIYIEIGQDLCAIQQMVTTAVA